MPGSREKVLVLDDEPLVVESLTMLLSDAWDVLGATSAAQARRLLDANEVAVLISDARMPEETGVELFGWAAARHPGTIRILLTGYADLATVQQAINDGKVWHFLRKPWDNHELRSLVRRAAEYRAQCLQVERSERRYRELFHHAHVGVLRCALDGAVIEANPAFVRALGLEGPAAAEDLRVADHLVDRNDWDLLVARLRAERDVQDVDLAMRHPARGVVYLRVNASLRLEGGAPVVEASAVDITDRRDADAAREDLAARLARVQRLETVATLASGAVHDLNNLLTVILGGAGTLPMLEGDDAERAACVRDIESAARSAGALTSQLLDVLRSGQGGAARPVDCNFIAREVQKLLRRSADRRVRVEAELDPALPPALADPGQVHQCLLNLCVNACDAMPGGGTLTLRTAAREVSGRDDLRPGRYVSLRVEDTGGGVDPAVRARIFEPLFSTKPAGERSGTGLGLALVDSIVRQRGGAVDVESEVGRGSAFTVLLPAASEVRATELPPATPQAGSATVLFVDDEPALRVQARRYLGALGYRVLTATDGRHALEVARANPDVAVAVLDLVMPVMGGDEALAALRDARPTLPVVLTTGYVFTPERRDVLRAEGLRLLRKPYPLERLAEVVRASLAGG